MPRKESAQDIFYQGVERLQRGHRDEARRIFLRLIREYSRFPDSYRELYQMGVEDGHIEETLALFDRLYAQDSRNGLPLAYKAMTLEVSGRGADAGPVFKQAILADPDNLGLGEPIAYWVPFDFTEKPWQEWFQIEKRRRAGGGLLFLLDDSIYCDAFKAERPQVDHFTSRLMNAQRILLMCSNDRSNCGTVLQYYQQVFEEVKRLGLPGSLAAVASDLAWAYEYQGDFVRATRSQLEALEIARRADHRQYMGHAERNLARLAIWLNDLSEAKRRLDLAEPLVQRFDAQRGRSELAVIRGHYLAASGQMAEAIESYRQALQQWRETGFWTTRTVDTMARLGRMLRIEKRYGEAAIQLREAETEAGAFNDRKARAVVRLEQARLALTLGHSHKAIGLITQGLDDDAATGNLSRTDLLATLVRAWQSARRPRAALGAGLSWAKAVWKEARKNTPGREMDSFFEDKAAAAERTLGLFWDLEGEQAASRSLKVAASLRAIALRSRLDADRSGEDPYSPTVIRRHLAMLAGPGDEFPILLALWTGSERSFLWVATPEGTWWWSVGGREKIAREVDRRLDVLQGSGGREAAAPVREVRGPIPATLADVFLPPEALTILSRGTSFLLAIDGPASRLPLEMTRLPDGRLLIERGPVTYLETITVPAPEERHDEVVGGLARIQVFPSQPTDDALSLASNGPVACVNFLQAIDSNSPARIAWHPAPLPSTLDEARALALVLGRSGYKSDVRLGATRDDLLEGRDAAAILHLAVHACINDQSPENSYIVLGPARHDSHLWEPLFAGEIAAAHLPFRLVTLSGCRTFQGRDVKGEGMVGMARAFHAAGVPFVVSSLWDVEDLATRVFMEEFYGRLAAGTPVSEALRQAQLSMLRSDRPALREPRVWASFRLTRTPRGDHSSHRETSIASK